MEKKRTYEKPELRKVRLDVKTSVLMVCNTSLSVDPAPTCQAGSGSCWYSGAS